MKSAHQQKKLFRIIGIVFLSALCAASLILFIITLRQLYTAGELQPSYDLKGPVHVHRTVTVATIMPWMTFNYLNVVFKLPPLYLQNALAITDSHYPNLRIDTYTKEHRLNSVFFLQNLQKAITSYSSFK